MAQSAFAGTSAIACSGHAGTHKPQTWHCSGCLHTAGSDVEFEPRGDWALKGLPGEWPLFAVKT
jgi:hypothetical protein